ncbi:MAG TPA: efflux transporter outer membrane subunit, partial [Nevskiaceae bacterium]|nr:efflux transporter outer membrane subunit [Nevskiaceae bacterium]
AQAQLEDAKAQDAALALSRAQLEHAIAVLLGTTTQAAALQPAPLDLDPPHFSASAPSQLLERRPDIAAAERRVAAANAQIGVARAAWFPSFTLGAALGFESGNAASWLDAPSRFWSLGPSAALTLLDFGARRAQNELARAQYDETVADYRQSVIGAYAAVEDQLAAQHWLSQQAQAQMRAAQAAERALAQARERYKGGIVTYLEVVSAQNTQLQAARAELDLRVRRLDAAVQLVKTLGGGWQADEKDSR